MTDSQPQPLADRIEIRDLELLVVCGVLEEEQTRKQPFRFEIDIYLDMTEAAATDDLAKTVNYGAVVQQIETDLGSANFELLERMASRVAQLVLEDPNAQSVTVTARKVRPPLPAHVGTTGVRIHRSRQ